MAAPSTARTSPDGETALSTRTTRPARFRASVGGARSEAGGLPATMPPRTRHPNVTAAQWSVNGGALGAVDLTQPGASVFGSNVFSEAVQRARLPKDVFKRLQRAVETGEGLDASLADAVAAAMKDWALEKGATH